MTNGTDAFKRARELKASVLQNVTILQPAFSSSSSQLNTKDSEDTLIATLRTSGMPWGDIVIRLNARRIAAREAPIWTEAAVYSRFILSNFATATPAKEVGFEPRDYAHLKNAGSGREGTTKAGNKRVKDFQNATELSANIRKPATIENAEGERVKTSETKGKDKGRGKGMAKGKGKEEYRRKGESEEEIVKLDGGMVEILMHAVAKVERNFWVYVADEVERESGKYIEPKELGKIFHDT